MSETKKINKAGYVRDRAKTTDQDVKDLVKHARENIHPDAEYYCLTSNLIYIQWPYGCDCEFKFDICYCDGTCNGA